MVTALERLQDSGLCDKAGGLNSDGFVRFATDKALFPDLNNALSIHTGGDAMNVPPAQPNRQPTGNEPAPADGASETSPHPQQTNMAKLGLGAGAKAAMFARRFASQATVSATSGNTTGV